MELKADSTKLSLNTFLIPAIEYGFRVSILASGSSGNTTYIETPKQKILVDAGLSGIKISQLLAQIGRKIEDIDSLFITHEHSDHVKGLGVLARKYDMNLYANEATWDALPKSCGEIDFRKKHIIETGEMITIGDMDVMSFGVSHDAAQPQFYAFQRNNRQFVMLTDTGYVSDHLRGLLRNADAYLIESNHDIDMLRYGKYPWHLKQRILGDEGHLSNEDGARAIREMLGDKTKHIYLGHLSRDNNMVKLAHDTAISILEEHEVGASQHLSIHDTDPQKATKLIEF